MIYAVTGCQDIWWSREIHLRHDKIKKRHQEQRNTKINLISALIATCHAAVTKYLAKATDVGRLPLFS